MSFDIPLDNDDDIPEQEISFPYNNGFEEEYKKGERSVIVVGTGGNLTARK